MKIKHTIIRTVFFFFILLSGFNIFSQQTEEVNRDGNIIFVTSEDSLMNEAIGKARERWNIFIKSFAEKKEYQENFGVKYPFELEDGYEHVWLNNLKLKNGILIGSVNNDPEFTREVKYGDRVKVDPRKISDWMYFENGKLKGGYTILAAIESLPEEQKKAMKISFGIENK